MAAKYYCIRRDFGRLPEVVRETTALASEHGFAFYEETITAYHVIGLTAEGKKEELKEALRRTKKFSEISYQLAHTWARSTLAEGLANLGRVNTALPLLTETFELMQRNDERYAESELHRIRGELALRQIEAREGAAVDVESVRPAVEQDFREAREIAHRQGAKLFELRAATGLGRLLIKAGRRDEARAMLSQTYESFIEGFDAPDLRAAKAVLEELNAASELGGANSDKPPG
jgi:tetratricopeptide (TPR) repeat protein